MAAIRICFTAFLVFVFSFNSNCQKAYFIDGYHGGVWGHYPDWNTRFMVDQLQKNPNWNINIELEPDTWDSAMVKDPAAYADFKKIFADQSFAGRIEYVNPSYGQSYLYNISGESIIRQFYYGMKKVKHHFPEAVFTSYSSEEPCFTSALPTILQSYGYKYASLKNPNTCWGGYTRAYGGELVNWIGPDNSSKLITVPRYEIESLQANSTWQTISWNNSKDYINAAFKYGIVNPVGMCLQDAGWRNGPWLGDGTRGYSPSYYKTWRDYIANYSIKTPKEVWRFSQEDMQVSLVWGSQILQRIGQQVRKAENKLVQAEKIAALSAIYQKQQWPAEVFELSWRPLLLAQHHDCWIVPYNRKFNTNWAGLVKIWTDRSNKNSDSLIYKQASTNENKGSNIRVYNTLGFDREEWVAADLPSDLQNSAVKITDQQSKELASQIITKDSSGSKQVLFKAKIPSLGYNSFKLVKASSAKNTSAAIVKMADGNYKMESDLYRIIIDPAKGGLIKSLVAKKLGNREFVDKNNKRGFNELRGNFFKDGGFHSSMDNAATIEIIENGPALMKIAVKGTIAGSPFTQHITLAEAQKRIDLKVKIDWKANTGIGNEYAQDVKWDQKDYHKAFYDDRDKLLVLFPSALSSQKLYKNAPFDVTESKNENTFFNTWDSIKHNIILNWVDITDAANNFGLALLTDHTTSYVHGKNHPLSLTMQYSGMGLWGRNYTITGPLEVNYSLIPHKGKWDNAGIYTESEKWNEPLIATFTDEPNGNDQAKSLVNTGDKLHLSSVNIEGNDLLVRVFNAESDNTPKKIVFNMPPTKMELVELDGSVKNVLTAKAEPGGKSSVSITVPKLGFRTIRIPSAIK